MRITTARSRWAVVAGTVLLIVMALLVVVLFTAGPSTALSIGAGILAAPILIGAAYGIALLCEWAGDGR